MPDAVVAGLKAEIAKMKVGPGVDAANDMGPLNTQQHFARRHRLQLPEQPLDRFAAPGPWTDLRADLVVENALDYHQLNPRRRGSLSSTTIRGRMMFLHWLCVPIFLAFKPQARSRPAP
jgi:hypothetical protein